MACLAILSPLNADVISSEFLIIFFYYYLLIIKLPDAVVCKLHRKVWTFLHISQVSEQDYLDGMWHQLRSV